MIIKWINRPNDTIETFAWWPIKAHDEYTKYTTWVWLRWVRYHRNGPSTFSSFGV